MFLRQESVVSAIGGRAALNGAAQNDPIINIRIARKIAVRKESDHEMKNAPLQERNHWCREPESNRHDVSTAGF